MKQASATRIPGAVDFQTHAIPRTTLPCCGLHLIGRVRNGFLTGFGVGLLAPTISARSGATAAS